MITRSYEMRSVSDLKRNPRNVRTHPDRQIRLLTKSIADVGLVNSFVIDETNTLLCGAGRLDACQKLGIREVPVVVIKGLSDQQKRTIPLSDNKLPELAGYDRAKLAVELKDLNVEFEQAGIDIELTGFQAAEIDALFGDLIDPEQDPADELPQIATSPVSRKGDVWKLGKHRLLCTDARQAVDMRKLMGRDLAVMVFTDPPYNVRVSSIQGRGKIQHREFVAASGEMSRKEFIKFLIVSLSNAAKHSTDGSIHYVCMTWKRIWEMIVAGTAVYSEHKNLVVWAKTNAGMGSFYRSQHELIFVFKTRGRAHKNNIELGRHGRNRTNVWTYPGANTFRAGRMEDLSAHPTVKPVALVADAMRDCSSRGDIVLDPFIGSGTTILAAERVGRRAYGIEIDPAYVDCAVQRWQAFAKCDAILEATDQTFEEVAAARSRKRSGGAK